MMATIKPPKDAKPFQFARIEIVPPAGANLQRAMECAHAVAAEFTGEGSRPAVEFAMGGIRYTVQAEGAI